MNKQRRNELTQLKYKKRVKRFASFSDVYRDRNGEYVYFPKAAYIMNDKGCLYFKTTAVPCSCWMCSGVDKYKRHQQRRVDRKLIEEELNDWRML